jgi:hypothetical protein
MNPATVMEIIQPMLMKWNDEIALLVKKLHNRRQSSRKVSRLHRQHQAHPAAQRDQLIKK